jgi:hypothetical protein
MWLYTTVRRYRAGSELEKLRAENLELKAQLQVLDQSAESAGGGVRIRGKRADSAAESANVLLTPPALPRTGGKLPKYASPPCYLIASPPSLLPLCVLHSRLYELLSQVVRTSPWRPVCHFPAF